MKSLSGKKIIITGAAGGIGVHLTQLLAKEGAALFLVGSNQEQLVKMQNEIKQKGGNANYIVADFASSQGIKDAAAVISEIDAPDILINLAGVSYFGSLGLQKLENIEQLYNVNLLAPVALTQAVLPEMVKNNSGQIVNIGSIVGSISFPYFTTYSSSKAGLRAFSEALRRELSGTKIKIGYIAPRTVKTPINKAPVVEFMKRTKAAIDEPADVAQKILCAIKTEKNYSYFGCAESFFVRLNYLFPALVDGGLKKQAEIAREILFE